MAKGPSKRVTVRHDGESGRYTFTGGTQGNAYMRHEMAAPGYLSVL